MIEVGLAYSLIAGIMAIFLLWQALEKKSEALFAFFMLFTIVSWSGIEWGLWTAGQNLFTLVFEPIVPLASYFVAWSLLIVYLSEKYFKRRDWIGFLLVVLAIILIASVCMDCL